MTEQTYTIPAPPAICDECIAANTVQSPDGSVLVIYCPHNKAGGLYMQKIHTWRIYGPVGGAEFANAVVMATLDAGWHGDGRCH